MKTSAQPHRTAGQSAFEQFIAYAVTCTIPAWAHWQISKFTVKAVAIHCASSNVYVAKCPYASCITFSLASYLVAWGLFISQINSQAHRCLTHHSRVDIDYWGYPWKMIHFFFVKLLQTLFCDVLKLQYSVFQYRSHTEVSYPQIIAFHCEDNPAKFIRQVWINQIVCFCYLRTFQ